MIVKATGLVIASPNHAETKGALWPSAVKLWNIDMEKLSYDCPSPRYSGALVSQAYAPVLKVYIETVNKERNTKVGRAFAVCPSNLNYRSAEDVTFGMSIAVERCGGGDLKPAAENPERQSRSETRSKHHPKLLIQPSGVAARE